MSGFVKRSCVLDASALIAMLRDEPGGDVVEELLETAAISSVNWSEVVQKALDWKTEIAGLRQDLEALGLEVVPFTALLAETTADLRAPRFTTHIAGSLVVWRSTITRCRIFVAGTGTIWMRC